MLALVVGTILALGALAFVLYPLFASTAPEVTLARAESTSQEGGMAGAVGEPVDLSDPIEAIVRAYRARVVDCARCGPRPEPDAVFCSNCGTFLPGACPGCGAKVGEEAAAFCSACGRQLAT